MNDDDITGWTVLVRLPHARAVVDVADLIEVTMQGSDIVLNTCTSRRLLSFGGHLMLQEDALKKISMSLSDYHGFLARKRVAEARKEAS